MALTNNVSKKPVTRQTWSMARSCSQGHANAVRTERSLAILCALPTCQKLVTTAMLAVRTTKKKEPKPSKKSASGPVWKPMSENGHIDTFKITVFASTGELEIDAIVLGHFHGFVLLLDTKTGRDYLVHHQRLAPYYAQRKRKTKVQRALRRPAA